jgi:transcriptional accessory protein Tex/SPT6
MDNQQVDVNVIIEDLLARVAGLTKECAIKTAQIKALEEQLKNVTESSPKES